MYKKFLPIPIMLLVIMSMVGFSFADTTTQPAAEESIEEPVGAGNKICPVSGEKIDEKTKATYEYKGKIYNFCCPTCLDEFKKDPEKYIQKVEQELQAESEEQSKHKEHEMGMMQESGESHQGVHQGHDH